MLGDHRLAFIGYGMGKSGKLYEERNQKPFDQEHKRLAVRAGEKVAFPLDAELVVKILSPPASTSVTSGPDELLSPPIARRRISGRVSTG